MSSLADREWWVKDDNFVMEYVINRPSGNISSKRTTNE